MKAPLVVLALLGAFALLPLVPVAGASAAPCIDTGSQWRACYANGCLIVDGAAFHAEYCFGELIGPIAFCTPQLGQFQACYDHPCLIVDGPALHKVVCLQGST